jgi:hypothetical protein
LGTGFVARVDGGVSGVTPSRLSRSSGSPLDRKPGGRIVEGTLPAFAAV